MRGERMTIYLTKNGQGITTEREPIRDTGTLRLYFRGDTADSVCVGGRFYPIKDGVAAIPTAEIVTPAPVIAHALGERRRYVCDAIGQIGEGKERMLVPLTEDAEGRLASLAIAACELSGRMDALEARKEAIARVTAEIENYDAVLMTGPTSIMHFCGLPTVTVAGGIKNQDGVNETVILYGKDEYRLYEAALAIEQVMLEMKGIREVLGF